MCEGTGACKGMREPGVCESVQGPGVCKTVRGHRDVQGQLWHPAAWVPPCRSCLAARDPYCVWLPPRGCVPFSEDLP